MPVPASEPKVLIMSLIKTNWVAGNLTPSLTPDFHTGWWNPESNSPQVTFTGDGESFQGQSGYGAIEGGGGGPVQVVNGTLIADCWASRDQGASGANPKLIVYEMAKEIRRVILANFGGATNLNYVSVVRIDDVPPEGDPLKFRKSVTIGFNWRTT
jgi:hypothetical protein